VANEYADWQELKEMRSIDPDRTEWDAALKRAVTRASRAIDNRTRPRRFYRDGTVSTRTISPYGRTVRENGSEILLLDDIADVSTLVVSIGGQETTSYTYTTPDAGWPVTSLSYSSWYGGDISITAEWGWPEVPASIEEATLLLANRRYMRKDSPEGTSGWSQEGAAGVSRFDQDIEDLVWPYLLDGFGA